MFQCWKFDFRFYYSYDHHILYINEKVFVFHFIEGNIKLQKVDNNSTMFTRLSISYIFVIKKFIMAPTICHSRFLLIEQYLKLFLGLKT